MRALLLALGLAILPACSDDDDDNDAADGAVACAEEATCDLCLICASSGPCESLSVGCQSDEDCRAFYLCLGEHDDPAVMEQCRTDHPDGEELYCSATECAVYEQCGEICEPSQVCPAP